MRRPLNKAGDDPPQGQQRLIDATGLARPTAAYTTPRNVLATGQVDQIKLAHTHHLLTLDAWFLNGINDGVIKHSAGIKKIYKIYFLLVCQGETNEFPYQSDNRREVTDEVTRKC